ncbi:MAG: RraA family protein [Lachnospiraceae bacterium]|nr:RraA family protein [Lachnospiraceae bacterium]
MSKVGCLVVKDFKRPEKELVEKFEGAAVANLDDCMNRISAVHESLRPINKSKLLGTAFTVKVPEGDNLMFHLAMDLAKPGDVIVIDAGGDTRRSIFGELMVTYCRSRGIAGIIVDGSIRDTDAMSKLTDFNIYYKGITPDGPYKNGPGEINTPVVCGGRTVYPGDIVIGDEDGVIFVRPEDAKELLEKLETIQKNEAHILDVMEKEGTYIRPWVGEKLESLSVEYKDYMEY